MNRRRLTVFLAGGLLIAVAAFALTQLNNDPPDAGQIGGPIRGLTKNQLQKFNQGKALFVKDFTPEEGLGPLFNGRSCYECHGKPGIAGTESTLLGVSSMRKIAKLRSSSVWASKSFDEAIQGVYSVDVNPLISKGGPALATRSISKEFPERFGKFWIPPASVPSSATFVSLRHAPALLGLGLLAAVPDESIKKTADDQWKRAGKAMGRPLLLRNPFEKEHRQARFGWKAPHPSVTAFTLEALNNEMGITTPAYPLAKSLVLPGRFPPDLKKILPPDPNDSGITAIKLAFYVNLLAPPPRGPITPQVEKGEGVFERSGCSVCHLPEYRTSEKVFLVDPDTDPKRLSERLSEFATSSPPDNTKYIEIRALENKPVRAYSDLLVHKMGRTLADGIPEQAAGGDYWRTTPLWGLRLKKFYLHDGRTTNLEEAIRAHSGQADSSVSAFKALSDQDRTALLAFLRSL